MALESPHAPSLVAIDPSDCLLFKLERNVASRVLLKVSNVSRNRIVFKVKTTQPSWYYVKPNQQILDVGQSEDIAIVLVETESNRFIEQYARGEPEKLDKHRFLVQSKILQDEEYFRLKGLNPAQRVEEFSKLWETQRDEKKNLKLRVEFKYPQAGEAAPTLNTSAPVTNTVASETVGSLGKPTTSLAQNVEIVRNKLARINASISDTSSAAAGGDSQESTRAELEGLKKKYDAVVEYTVHLTAERDTIVAQLEEAQRELSREIAAKKRLGNGAERDGLAGGKTGVKGEKGDKKVIQKGFSLFFLFFVAIFSFALGRYLRS